MKIVIAPDSYKGSLTAKEACTAIEKGLLRAIPYAEVIKVPMADGGEGTTQSLVDSLGGILVECEVKNPLGELVIAKYGILNNGTAVIEMAEASGLNLVEKNKRNPLIATTYGTGELIKDALDKGCQDFILGIGGSATNDGGAGMAQALGFGLFDQWDKQISFGGGCLSNIKKIDVSKVDSRIWESRFVVACDVDNPLCGENGASMIFGPQKGATPEMISVLDDNLDYFANIIHRDLGIKVKDISGSGAAGGLGAGTLAFLNATLKPGIEIVIEAVELEKKLVGADLVITGEGSCDYQTVNGKTPYGVARTAKRLGVPVVIIAGQIGNGTEILYEHGVVGVFTLVNGPTTLNDAIQNAGTLIESASERILHCINFFM